MNGVHDLGGMHGLGPIHPEPEGSEPTFHQAWEGRVFAMAQATSVFGRWSGDDGRYARERMEPVDYLTASYFERHLHRLETLLVEKGVLTQEELANGRPAGPAPADLTERRMSADDVSGTLTRSPNYVRDVTGAPAFSPGDRIRVRQINTTGHTRAPRYVRGQYGTIRAHYGAHVLPDRSVHGEKVGVHLFSVRFSATELWGETAAANDSVYLDLWEVYLEAAT